MEIAGKSWINVDPSWIAQGFEVCELRCRERQYSQRFCGQAEQVFIRLASF